MAKKSTSAPKTAPLVPQTKAARPPVVTRPKAKAAAVPKPSRSLKIEKADDLAQVAVRDVMMEDPFVEALVAHEGEIARLSAVILDLRGQQVGWINATIDQPLRQEIAPPIDILGAAQDEINRLTTALSQAWTELETKQSYLQSAMDNGAALKAALDVSLEESAKIALENRTLKQQIDVTTKRLSIALEVVARHGYS